MVVQIVLAFIVALWLTKDASRERVIAYFVFALLLLCKVAHHYLHYDGDIMYQIYLFYFLIIVGVCHWNHTTQTKWYSFTCVIQAFYLCNSIIHAYVFDTNPLLELWKKYHVLQIFGGLSLFILIDKERWNGLVHRWSVHDP